MDDETRSTLLIITGVILFFIHPALAVFGLFALFLIVIYINRHDIGEMTKPPESKKSKPKRYIPDVEPEDFERLLRGNIYMSSKEKAEYLKSPKWKALRWKVFQRDKFRCVTCDSDKNLRCHHVTYERLGDEELEDLATLCTDCHSKLHENLGYDRLGKYVPKNYIDYLIEKKL